MRRATEFDRAVGERIRRSRASCGISQEALAEALGVAHQQIYKYEAGRDRLTSERLFVIARVLRTSVDVLLGLDHLPNGNEERLVKAFSTISSSAIRDVIADLVVTVAREAA